MDMTASEIADLLGGAVVGDGTVHIHGLNGLREAGETDLAFLADSRYERYLATSRAAAVLVGPGVQCNGKTLIHVDNPRLAMFLLLKRIEAETAAPLGGIHPTAVISPTAELGNAVTVGPYAVIGDDSVVGDGATIGAHSYVGRACRIGAETLLNPRVTVYDRVVIGARCILHSGAVIGADGFGFAEQDGVLVKIPQVGAVIIGDDVEIGSNSCIDRATMGATVIGDGSKIDNLVQIGHNVQLGRNCVVCGNAGIAGSTVLSDHVIIGAGAGINGHIEIGERARVAAFSGVTKSVPAGTTFFGYPAVEADRNRRMQAALRQLPDTQRRVKSLEQRIAQLEGTLNGTPKDDR